MVLKNTKVSLGYKVMSDQENNLFMHFYSIGRGSGHSSPPSPPPPTLTQDEKDEIYELVGEHEFGKTPFGECPFGECPFGKNMWCPIILRWWMRCKVNACLRTAYKLYILKGSVKNIHSGFKPGS